MLGTVDYLELYVFLGRFSRFLLYQVAEIAWRKARLVGKIAYRGQPLPLRAAAAEIVVQLVLELMQHVAVHLAARAELAVVEAQAIFEEQFYVRAKQFAAMRVDGVFRLGLYVAQAAGKEFLLAVGQVQRLVLSIVEEGIALHALGQRGAVYKVGVENQAGHVHRLFFVDDVHLHRLPGGETHHRAFLVIVLLAAVAQRAIHAVLDE